MREHAFRTMLRSRRPARQALSSALLWPLAFSAMLASACGSDIEISSIQPSSGSARGGEKITIRGEGFGSDSTVSFSGTPARAVKVVSEEELEVTTPTVLAKSTDVKVESDGDEATKSNGFTFVPLELRYVEAPSHYLPVLDEINVADVATADFDRDGDPDLFLAGSGTPSTLLRNAGSGSFATGVAPSLDAGVPADASAPSDGGAPDVSESDASGLDASGPDAAGADAGGAPSLSSFTNSVRKVLAEDFDKDGDTDLFLCNAGGEAHRLMLNDGKGSFAESADLPVTADDCLDAALSDVDGDGRSDVVILGKGRIGRGKTYARTLIAGTGPLLALPKEGEPQGQVQDLACGTTAGSVEGIKGELAFDLTGAFAGAVSGKASFDFGTATGSVAYTLPAPALHKVPTALELDVEGQAVGNMITLKVVDAEDEEFWVDAGAQSWTGWRHLKADALTTWKHSGGDDDGTIDLPLKTVSVVVGSDGKAKASIRLDSIMFQVAGTGWVVVEDFERLDFPAAFSVAYGAMDVGDLDGNGIPDLFLGSAADAASPRGTVVLGSRPAKGAFSLQPGGAGLVPELPDPISHVSLLDADGDSDLDVAAVSDGGQDRLLINDGMGHFFDDTLARMPLDRSHGRSASVADLDLDGLPDLAIANIGEVNRLYVNRGTKGFVDVTPALPLHALKTLRMIPLDIDSDGDLDLFVLNQKGETSKLYVSVEPVGRD